MPDAHSWPLTVYGRYGSLVGCTATAYPNALVVTGEAEHLTPAMLLRAVRKDHPEYAWTVTEEYGYLKATGVQC